MINNKITDVFFDLDHTLWDFEANSKLAFEKLLVKNNIPIKIDVFLEVYEPVNKQYWEDYAQGKKNKNEVKYGRLFDTFSQLNFAVNDKFIEQFANDYLDFLKDEKILMEGAIEILKYLKNKYRLHILTNGFIEIQEKKIKKAGLFDFFETIISSEEIGMQKPHPEVFRYALKKANTLAHKSIMIGDNFKSDVLGARNVGMQAIHYDPLNENKVDDKIIPKVDSLLKIIKLI